MIGSMIEGPPDDLMNDIMNANKDFNDGEMDLPLPNDKSMFEDLMFGNANPDDLENETGELDDLPLPLDFEGSKNELTDILGGEEPTAEEAAEYFKAS